MDIEMYNRQVISQIPAIKPYYSPRGSFRDDLVESVRKHREYHGLTSKISILRSLVRTKKFTRTVTPKNS